MDYYPDYPEFERYHSTEQLPIEPISPDDLATAVVDKLSSFPNTVVPEKTSQMVKELCRGFNECINLNKPTIRPTVKYKIPYTSIFSPKTGSAKSLSAKMYASLLPTQYKVLFVVIRVDDATKFCEDINDWSGNPNKARCYYNVDLDHPDHHLRIEENEIDHHQCLVITHEKFKRLNLYSSQMSRILQKKRRDLIIIDERISFFEKHVITSEKIRALINAIVSLNSILPEPLQLNQTVESLEELLTSIEYLHQLCSENNIDTLYIDKDGIRHKNEIDGEEQIVTEQFNIPSNDAYQFDTLLQRITTRQNLRRFATPLAETVNDDDIRETVKRLCNSILMLKEYKFLYNKRGDLGLLVLHEKIENKLGSCVILDATAEVNRVYDDLVWYDESIMHYETTDPRTYSNLTIHKAFGYPQGRTAIYEDLSVDEITTKANDYIQIANSLMSESDKMLVITFMDFKPYLEACNTSDQIVFTHWGNHIGKNEWSDCNKVMIIGWYYIPKSEHRINLLNATRSTTTATELYSTEINQEYELSRLTDDLVQGSMRGSARITIDSDGNCAPSDVYIFVPKNKNGYTVMDLYESQFKDANIQHWILPLHESSIRDAITKEDQIIDYIGNHMLDKNEMLAKDCRIALDIKEAQFSKLQKSRQVIDYFRINNIITERRVRSLYFVKK